MLSALNSSYEADVASLVGLLDKRETEIANLHNENSKLHEEIAVLRLSLGQTKSLRSEIAAKNAEISSLQTLVTSMQATATRWELLAGEHCSKAAKSSEICDSIREQLDKEKTENLELREFVRDLLSLVRVEKVPKNFRLPLKTASPALRAAVRGLMGELRDLDRRLIAVGEAVSAGQVAVDRLRREVIETLDTGKRKAAQLKELAEGVGQGLQ